MATNKEDTARSTSCRTQQNGIELIRAKNEETGNEIPYSSFTARQKHFLAYAASISAMFSGLSSFIYFPAITALAKSLKTSVGNINYTITAYLVMAGLGPSILGDLADRVGRRPVSILAMILFFGANLGLAIQEDYIALLILRCIQSAGASSTIALAYGIISDISTPAERGMFMGVLMGFTNIAPSFGPVIGGLLAEKISWHWIFWLLTILSGIHLILLFIFLPETSRNLVGDGSWEPLHWMSKALYTISGPPRHIICPRSQQMAHLALPNPFSCLLALYDRCNFLVIAVGGLQYMIFGCLAASLSTQMIQIYSLNYLLAGLIYLPSGVGGIIAAYLTGRLLDYEYRQTAQKRSLPASRNQSNITDFPIEEARLRSIFLFFVISATATAGYGWTLHAQTHIAAPIVMQFFTGGASVAIFVICGALLTDLNQARSATVQASYNLIRCGLGAAGVAALQPVVDSVGTGWCFTILAIVSISCIPVLLLLRSRGHAWRRAGMLLELPISTTESPCQAKKVDSIQHSRNGRIV